MDGARGMNHRDTETQRKSISDLKFQICNSFFSVSLCLCGLLVSLPARGAPIEELLPARVNVGVARGLAYLAKQQQADGSFTGFDEPGPRALPAAEAIIAFLSAGQTPVAGRHALAVRNAVDYLVRQSPDDGDFGRADGSGSYGQVVITVALAQAYGLEGDANQRRQIRDALGQSQRVILAAQEARGEKGGAAWRRQNKSEPDLEITLAMVLALRALDGVGIETPREAMQRAATFVRSCARPTGFADPGGAVTVTSTAAGVSVLLMTGAATADELGDALKLVAEKRVEADPAREPDYFRSVYAVVLAAMLAGEPTWSAAWGPARDEVLKKQNDDGSWFPLRQPGVGLGTVPATAQAVMTLAMPYRLLPLYGR